MNNALTDNHKGLLLVCLGTTLFSSKSILIQLAFKAGATVDELMLIRMLVALPIYILIGYFAWKRLTITPSLQAIAVIALSGFACYHIASYLDMWSLQFLTAGLERIVLFSYPIFVVILHSFAGQTISRAQWFGLAVAYSGVALFFIQDIQLHENTSLIAVLAVVLASLLTAFYMIASQKYGRKYNSDLFTAVAMGITGITIPSHYVAMHGINVSSISGEIWAYGIFLSLFLTVLASFVLNRGIAIVGANKASVTGMLGPLLTLTLAAYILDEPLTWVHGLAVMTTIIGIVLVTQPNGIIIRSLNYKIKAIAASLRSSN